MSIREPRRFFTCALATYGGTRGNTGIHFLLSPEIARWMFFYYAGSLGSLGHAHPNLQYMLDGIGRADLLRATQVRVGDWGTLCETFGVGRVDVLQLDCEGRDCAILRGLMRYCRAHPWSFPRIIQFEANHLTPAFEVETTLANLARCGYRITYRSEFNVMVTREPRRCRATRRKRAR